jgi:hypothetical protein
MVKIGEDCIKFNRIKEQTCSNCRNKTKHIYCYLYMGKNVLKKVCYIKMNSIKDEIGNLLYLNIHSTI